MFNICQVIISLENFFIDISNFRFPERVSPFQANLKSGKVARVLPSIKRTMLDGKMRSIVSGRGEAFCTSCNQTAGSYYGKVSKYTADPLVRKMSHILLYRILFYRDY